MKKFFVHELKSFLWAFVLLTVVCAVPYLATVSTMPLYYTYWLEGIQMNGAPTNPNVSLVNWLAIALCFVAPPLVYSFKMSKRGVDAYYALPLKKEKLYFVRGAVGALLVLVPYTLAFWLGFLALVLRAENGFAMGWYVPTYFGFVLYLVLLFGLNAFAYTRANKLADGVVFMLAYAFLGTLAVEYIQQITHQYFYWWTTENFSSFGGAAAFTANMNEMIWGHQTRWSPFTFILPVVYGGAGYALLFALANKEKGEAAEQVCLSWFGYKVLIPLYLALWIALFGGTIDVFNLCLVAVCGIVAIVVWQRKFAFSWKYWLLLAGTIGVGILLGWVCQFTVPPDTNLPTEMFAGVFAGVSAGV